MATRLGGKLGLELLPHAITESVPPFKEWTRLIAYGVGQKSIQVNRDASSEELVRTLNK
jgi:hypothetical protein